MEKAPLWRLEGSRAELTSCGASILLDQPANGIRDLAGCEGHFLGLRPSQRQCGDLRLEDAYARGKDLVAQYSPTESFPFATEVYWRAEATGTRAVQFSMIVSVQTDLLDTQPELTVESRILPSEADQPTRLINSHGGLVEAAAGDPGEALILGLEGSSSWFEAVHPTDRSEAELALDTAKEGGQVIQWKLFSRFLEKGVIRRARVAGALIRGGGLQQAREIYEGFACQTPPLTV